MHNRIGIKITKNKPVNLNRAKGALKHCSFVGLARAGDKKLEKELYKKI